MLILSRKNRESVVIEGADGFHRLLKVTVLEIRDTHVKLGFEVDPECGSMCRTFGTKPGRPNEGTPNYVLI